MNPTSGERHPEIEQLLAASTPAMTQETAWGNGTLPLRVSAFLDPVDLPATFVTSVRCFVGVGDQLVVCETPDGRWHPWPGGRREPLETYEQTACREVHEETGWILDVNTLVCIGWLHLEHLSAAPPHYPYPHPDFLQVVYVALASSREGGVNAAWVDTDGYELRSQLKSIDEARLLTKSADMPADPFFDVVSRQIRHRKPSAP